MLLTTQIKYWQRSAFHKQDAFSNFWSIVVWWFYNTLTYAMQEIKQPNILQHNLFVMCYRNTTLWYKWQIKNTNMDKNDGHVKQSVSLHIGYTKNKKEDATWRNRRPNCCKWECVFMEQKQHIKNKPCQWILALRRCSDISRVRVSYWMFQPPYKCF